MSDEFMGFLALCVSVPMSIRQYKKVMGCNTKWDRFVEKAKLNGCVVTGVCVDTTMLVGDSDANNLDERSPTLRVKYEYCVNGNTYYTYHHFQNPGSSRIRYPDTITIYYDSRKPRKNVSTLDLSSSARREFGCLTAVAIWFIVNMVIVGILKLLFQR